MNQTLLTLCLIILLILPINIHAQNLGFSQDNYFKDEIPFGKVLLCTSENHVGLNFENGKFETRRFKPLALIIEKMDHRKLTEEETYPSNISCYYDLGDERENTKPKLEDVINLYLPTFGEMYEGRRLNRCYLIRDKDDPMAKIMSYAQMCYETRNNDTGETTINCGREYNFQIDGEFVKIPKFFPTFDKKYRDSISVANGTCISLF
jgi:hypothetical protein